MKIQKIHAREILDSRGNPTIEVKVFLENGVSGGASVPSGASTGVHEALELRDGDKKRYKGKGVLKAVKNVNTVISKALIGQDVTKQTQIDRKMIKLDGTENKSRLGANAILGVSLASAHTAAKALDMPLYKYIRQAYELKGDYKLPVPTMNILNGGKHADSGLSIQEFMIVPQAERFHERVRQGTEVFHSLKEILKKRKYLTLVGDEGGFAPTLKDNEKAVKVIIEAIQKAGYRPGKDIYLASDFAASEFYQKGKYYFKSPKIGWGAEKIIDIMEKWVEKYPFVSIEDGLDEDDWENWQILTERLGKKVLLVGDDLFVTNIKRLRQGIRKKVGNAILIKLNQIGSLTETINCIKLAKKNRYKVIISHRSGETCDTTIADLAVAVNAQFIKTGSLSRSERVAKYNRLMEIEEELNNH